MKSIPNYRINLELPEEQRWLEVIRSEKAPARAVLREAIEHVQNLIPTRAIQKLSASLLEIFYRRSGGLYQREMEAWARSLRIPVPDMVMVQCMYELSHVGLEKFIPRLPSILRGISLPRLGCTVGIHRVPGHGLTHFRSLDWPLQTAAAATRLFTFVSGRREFVTAGIAGFTGVLSGMLPGAYSVSINWAPSDRNPRFEFGPAFLVRHVLETCDTYVEARRALRDTPLSANVFFALCGTREACVIERTTDEASVRTYRGKPLVQGNHFFSRRFAHLNSDDEGEGGEELETLTGSSRERCVVLGGLLSANRARYGRGAMGAMVRTPPVRNEETVHSVVFCPAQGTVDLWTGS